MPEIVQRIEAETGLAGLLRALGESLSASDVRSLLMETFRIRTSRLSPADLVRNSARESLTGSVVDARILNQFDGAAFEAASGFDAIDLSPISPLGTSRVLGGIDQNNVLTTIRNAEVTADTTSALAIECARRRKLTDPGTVRLCASQRVVRLQPFTSPGHRSHFRLFSMVSAGRDTGSHTFEVESLREQIRVYLSLFRLLNERGFRFGSTVVEVCDTTVVQTLLAAAGVDLTELRQVVRAHKLDASKQYLRDKGINLPSALADLASVNADVYRLRAVEKSVFEPLSREFGEAEFRFDLSRLEGLTYYSGLCLRIAPMAPNGSRSPIADGGFTDWTARLLGNRKERCLCSGIGTELACLRYR